MLSESCLHPNGYQTGEMPLMTNVVYKDLLSHIGLDIDKLTKSQYVNYNDSTNHPAPTTPDSAECDIMQPSTDISIHLSNKSTQDTDIIDLSADIETTSICHSNCFDLSADDDNDSHTHSVTIIQDHDENTLRILTLASQANLDEHNLTTVFNHPSLQLIIIEKFNIPMTIEKLRCLCPTNWLNDEVINFYMLHVAGTRQNSLRAKPGTGIIAFLQHFLH
jgi:Ulp1 family protease